MVVLEGGGGSWKVNLWQVLGLSCLSRKGRRHSAGSQIVRTTLPPNGVFLVSLEDKMTKDPWLFWRGGVEVERWIFGKSWVCSAWSSWKGKRHSAGSQIVRTTHPSSSFWFFLTHIKSNVEKSFFSYMCLFACSMNWTHCEIFGILILNPLKKPGAGRQWHCWGCVFVLDFDSWSMGAQPWHTIGGQPLLLGLSRTPKPPKVIGCFTRGGHA